MTDSVTLLTHKIRNARELCLDGRYDEGSNLFRKCVREAIFLRHQLLSTPASPIHVFVEEIKHEYSEIQRYIDTLSMLKQTRHIGPKSNIGLVGADVLKRQHEGETAPSLMPALTDHSSEGIRRHNVPVTAALMLKRYKKDIGNKNTQNFTPSTRTAHAQGTRTVAKRKRTNKLATTEEMPEPVVGVPANRPKHPYLKRQNASYTRNSYNSSIGQ